MFPVSHDKAQALRTRMAALGVREEDLVVDGMAGGSGGDCNDGIGCSTDSDCLSGSCSDDGECLTPE